jgi:hypothetical protein
VRGLVIAAALLVGCAATPAHAYLGPGMGVGAIVVMFSIVGAIFLALFAVIWYPIKRLLRRVKPGGNTEPSVKKGGSAQGPKS